jgi:hypothetical protein
MAQQHPFLLGALGLAAGTALMYALRSAQHDERRPARTRRSDRWDERGVSSRSSAAKRTGSAGYRSPDARSAGGRRAGEMSSERETHGLADRASESVGSLASSAADMASGVAGTASRALGAAGEAVTSSASSAYGAASSAARSAADVAYSAARRAPQASAYVGDQVAELGERYPLLLGAVSMAVGAAVGGALRLSESENRLMGPLSDRLKQRAWEAADEQYHLAREAAEHFAGELQTRFAGDAGNGEDKDRSADFETVLGGGQPPVGSGAQPGASKAPLGRPGGTPT